MRVHALLGAFAGIALFATGAAALPGATTPGAAGARSLAQQHDLLTEVAQGCGPGGYRTRGGRCVYHRPPPPRYRHGHYHRHRWGPPPRHCVVRHTPHGPRRVCR
ncbi:GCG_CRPN prefix-to-repeats domain-containing protein [Camelimonas abortus]|uniref:GCG_CRPN prefix-to-repeats domain-containing protein n=1 Tax=Camelimonas abortus TaxID=1017184 RepID=A0ABV7LDG1_9HYPH